LIRSERSTFEHVARRGAGAGGRIMVSSADGLGRETHAAGSVLGWALLMYRS
jgi:hypothetical protein